MADTKDNGGPAANMSLRDYFAAKAMQGLLTHEEIVSSMKDAKRVADLAADAYLLADSMLKARGSK